MRTVSEKAEKELWLKMPGMTGVDNDGNRVGQTSEDQNDRIFFFNPFSVEILKSVMHRIKESWYGNPRQILLLFYYIQDEYVSYLMAMDELMFVDEIDCRDLFEGVNPRERIMVFEMG